MNSLELHMEKAHVHKLLCAANGDAALLYLYLQSGNSLQNAQVDLNLNESRLQCAGATLRQLGLWTEQKVAPLMVGERPHYTEQDVLCAAGTDMDFRALCGEVQRLIGKTLTTEELKILLGIVRYLGLPSEVIFVMINYCKERAQEKGRRTPSLRAIEKEAYVWAERGIDTMEEAGTYIQSQKLRNSRMGRLMKLLQIRGRNLTSAEERYAQQWLDWGFEDEAIAMAYERTCLNTGGLSWAYMNKILLRWQENGLLTAEQIRSGDRKPVPQGATGQLGDAEREAIANLLREG